MGKHQDPSTELLTFLGEDFASTGGQVEPLQRAHRAASGCGMAGCSKEKAATQQDRNQIGGITTVPSDEGPCHQSLPFTNIWSLKVSTSTSQPQDI